MLTSTDIDVRKKALNLALAMVSSKNVEEVVMLLKKELSKTLDEQYEKVRSPVGPDIAAKALTVIEQRIQTTPDTFYTSMRNQVL